MANASLTASHPQQHQQKSDKTLAAKRKAIGLELVKVFAPTPAERAAADKRKAEAEAEKRQQEARVNLLGSLLSRIQSCSICAYRAFVLSGRFLFFAFPNS